MKTCPLLSLSLSFSSKNFVPGKKKEEEKEEESGRSHWTEHMWNERASECEHLVSKWVRNGGAARARWEVQMKVFARKKKSWVPCKKSRRSYMLISCYWMWTTFFSLSIQDKGSCRSQAVRESLKRVRVGTQQEWRAAWILLQSSLYRSHDVRLAVIIICCWFDSSFFSFSCETCHILKRGMIEKKCNSGTKILHHTHTHT